ncbi:MAG TPA: UDP-N-acetylglucosamine 2-epimerase (non-hydrolyzing) [Terriglobia bacterium]|nr:UDP-N-acetylglucosamine 2-epimerase (non-hydrolyzing) [Terriglobia bacterium]
MKILSVVGARPNFVKVAPLLAEMRRYPDLRSVLVHTGQHSDEAMSDCFLRELQIPPPDFVLEGAAARAVSPAEAMAKAIAPILRRERPDAVLVVGDVNSTLAGALAAARLGIPVAHVEAGLRSFDRSMPEETNRVLTDSVSSLLFASEPSAVRNLLAEGQPAGRIFLTGNVMIDSLRRWCAQAGRSAILARLGLLGGGGAARPYVLVTLHRPATVDAPAVLRGVWEALGAVSERAPVVFPVHPRTQARLGELGLEGALEGGGTGGGIRVLPPLPYLEFLHLESRAALAITDSGGVQEETTAFGVPCLTARPNTERPVTLTEGTNQLVGLDPRHILGAALRILSGEVKPGRLPRLWDGRSAGHIVRVLHSHLSVQAPPFAGADSPSLFPCLTLPAPSLPPPLPAGAR